MLVCSLSQSFRIHYISWLWLAGPWKLGCCLDPSGSQRGGTRSRASGNQGGHIPSLSPCKKSHPFWKFASQNYTSRAEERKKQAPRDPDTQLGGVEGPAWSSSSVAGLQGLGCWVPPDPTCCLLPRSPLASGPGLLACPPLIIPSLLLGAKLSETSSMRSKSKLTLPVLQYLWWARCSQVWGSGKGPLHWPESKTVTEPTCYFLSQFISFL